MTLTEQLTALNSRLHRIESLLKEVMPKAKAGKPKEWLTKEEVENEFGLSASTLQKYRRSGKIMNYKSRGGRHFTYSRKELENLSK